MPSDEVKLSSFYYFYPDTCVHIISNKTIEMTYMETHN